MEVKVKILDNKASLPTKAKAQDTGYDVKFIGQKEIVGDTIFFRTGIAIEPPEGYYIEIVPRSSISKLPFMLANSVAIIDEGYRGEILVPIRILHPNVGDYVQGDIRPMGMMSLYGKRPQSLQAVAHAILERGDALVQLVIRQRIEADFVRVNELSVTERADGGFGSTNKVPEAPTSRPKRANASKDMEIAPRKKGAVRRSDVSME